MARLPRIVVPGYPLHVVQRGNNRQACFFTDDDYTFYLECIHGAAMRYGCAVHAYALMTNHVHLLLTPAEPRSASHAIQSVGRSYVRYVNNTYRRTGTLWEGRYKSALVDSERYFLTCSRYIELNPVRAGMVDRPEHYRWTSYLCNALGSPDPLVTYHPIYAELGRSADERQAAYSDLFDNCADPAEDKEIRDATERSAVIGDERFRNGIEATLNRRVRIYAHGGDRKSPGFCKDQKG